MKTLLQVNTSLYAREGQSSRLATEFVDQWLQANPDGEVIVRDLAERPVPHLTAKRFRAFQADPTERTTEQVAWVAESDELIDELRSADEIVIGLPMYNFGIPSTLKAWIDHVARAGVTFRYTPKGPQGLLTDRPVTIIAARGGRYRGTPMDTQAGYIETFLNFIGLSRIEFVYAEGLAQGDPARQLSLGQAREKIGRLAA
jgi:FMN-dependent NADH-azoreductase